LLKEYFELICKEIFGKLQVKDEQLQLHFWNLQKQRTKFIPNVSSLQLFLLFCKADGCSRALPLGKQP